MAVDHRIFTLQPLRRGGGQCIPQEAAHNLSSWLSCHPYKKQETPWGFIRKRLLLTFQHFYMYADFIKHHKNHYLFLFYTLRWGTFDCEWTIVENTSGSRFCNVTFTLSFNSVSLHFHYNIDFTFTSLSLYFGFILTSLALSFHYNIDFTFTFTFISFSLNFISL